MSEKPHHKGLAPDERRRVRAALDRLLADADGVQRELSRRLGVSHTTISHVYDTDAPRPPGMTVARACADALGISLHELLTGEAPPPSDPSPPVGSLPGWAEAEAAARSAHPWIPAAAWDLTRQVRLPYAPRISAEWAAALATDVARSM